MINSIFKTFLLSLCIVANTHLAYAQTASILPPAKTQFLDNSGKPLTSGTVDFYIPSTTTRKTTWQNAAETIPNTNPVVLDAGGRALILGEGSYRQVVKDRLGNTIWDQVTSSTGSGSTPSVSTGDGDLVGTIKPWAGMTAPNQYAFTYGQEVNRTTYATLFTAITSSQPTFCTSASPILTGLTDTTNFWIGMSLEVSCVAAGFSTVVSKTATTLTMAANANVTTNTTVIFYPWGRGNGTTTFNLPDFRGVPIAGNNNMGGVASSILTTTYFGASDPNSSGALGGVENRTLLLANLPPYTPSASSIVATGGAISLNAVTPVRNLTSVGGATTLTEVSLGNDANASAGSLNVPVSGTVTSTATFNAQGGSSTSFSIVQPTRTSNYIIKITPDTNSATASGVTSLGGMTGDIACGSGLLCTGNTISSIGSTLTVGTSPIFSGTTTRVLYDNAGILGEYNISGTGSVAMTTNPIFVTPNLGTPSAVVLTNATGFPYATGGTGVLPVANGGTNGSVASGTLLDNITGFASTGFLTRTGAGTYAFQSTTNGITNANLVQSAAATLKGNPTAALANATDFTIQGLTDIVTPNTTLDVIPIYDNATGTIKRTNASQLVAAVGGGVTNVASGNGLIGGPITTTGTLTIEQINPGGRITLASATPYMQSSQTAITNIWYAPVGSGKYVPLYTSGTGMRLLPFTTSDTDNVGPTIAMAANAAWAADSNYDVWAYVNGTQASICTGPDWSAGAVAGSNAVGSSTRGTGANSTEHQFFKGFQTNAVTMTCRTGIASTISCAVNECTYLGYFRTTTQGTTTFTYGASGTAGKHYVYNAYNQSHVCSKPFQSANWNYTSSTIRQQAGNTVTQVDFLQEGSSSVTATSLVTANVAAVIGAYYRTGVALNSITVMDVGSQNTNVAAQTLTANQNVPNVYSGTFGPNYIAATEQGDNVNANLGVNSFSILNVCMAM